MYLTADLLPFWRKIYWLDAEKWIQSNDLGWRDYADLLAITDICD